MSIRGIACSCGSSASVFRTYLKNSGYENWQFAILDRDRGTNRKVWDELCSKYPISEQLAEQVRKIISGIHPYCFLIGDGDGSMELVSLPMGSNKSPEIMENAAKKVENLVNKYKNGVK